MDDLKQSTKEQRVLYVTSATDALERRIRTLEVGILGLTEVMQSVQRALDTIASRVQRYK